MAFRPYGTSYRYSDGGGGSPYTRPSSTYDPYGLYGSKTSTPIYQPPAYQPPVSTYQPTPYSYGPGTPSQPARQDQSIDEAARRAELDRIAQENARQIAEARRRDYLAQIEEARRLAQERAQREARMAQLQDQMERIKSGNLEPAKTIKGTVQNKKAEPDYRPSVSDALLQFALLSGGYGKTPSDEAFGKMWGMGGLDYKPGSLLMSDAMRYYDVLYGPNAPMNRVENLPPKPDMMAQDFADKQLMGAYSSTALGPKDYPWEGVHFDMAQDFEDKKLMSYLDTFYGVDPSASFDDYPGYPEYPGYEYPEYEYPEYGSHGFETRGNYTPYQNFGNYGGSTANYRGPGGSSGGYSKPSTSGASQPKSWYEKMLKWNI